MATASSTTDADGRGDESAARDASSHPPLTSSTTSSSSSCQRADTPPALSSTPTTPNTSTVIKKDSVALEAKKVALAASIAAVLTKSVLHPIDTIKCRLQVISLSVPESTATTHTATTTTGHPHGTWVSGTQPHLSFYQRMRQLRTHYRGCWGLRYLYGGLPVKLLMYVPYQTTYLVTYETAKTFLHTTEAQQRDAAHPFRSHLWRTATAAVAAEVGACVIRIPMETVKVRIQATKASNTRDAFRQIRRNGLRAYARLIVPHTLAHDVPYSITQWIVYETLRPWTMHWHTQLSVEEKPAHTTTRGDGGQSRPLTFRQRYGSEMLRAFMSGGFSGFVASALTVPMDNVRTRTVVASANDPTITARQVIRQTLRLEGVRGFMKGGGMRVLWVTSNLACYFPVFELLKKLIAESTPP